MSPLSLKDFTDNYFEKKAVFIKGNAEKFSELFNWDCLNQILSTSYIPETQISMATNGVEEKLKPGNFRNAKIFNDIISGSTLHIRNVHEFDENMYNYFFLLANELKAIIYVNLYASPPKHQALNIHFDTHDIFVFQIEGRKKWQVYYPDYFEKDQDRPHDNPYLECDLEPGDILYLPIGHWHKALAEKPSLHLAVSTNWVSGLTFYNLLLNKIRPEIIGHFTLLPLKKNKANFQDGWKQCHSEYNKIVKEKLEKQDLINEIFQDAKHKIQDRINFNFPYK